MLQKFAEDLTSPVDSVLQEIEDYTYQYHADPQMLSGHLQGKVLEMISRMIGPTRILEIGTFTGYSALCLAKGLSSDGILHTIELRENDATRARDYFNKAGFEKKIIVHTGNALSIAGSLNETWDLVFIDADKTGYIDYFTLVFPHVKKNGFILADNIFFHGQVLEQDVKGKNAKAIMAFNQFIKNRSDIDKVALTIRDGLYLIRKL